MDNTNKIPDFLQIVSDLKKNAARFAGTESVKFFKNSFVKGGFTDASFQPWQKSSNPLAGNKTMYQIGTTMQSIRKVSETDSKIIVQSDTPSSQIHNEGGTIVVTKQMKRFFWAKYYEFAGKTKKTKSGKQSRSKSNLAVNAKAEFCRRMALMKVGSKIKIPKRQFMGNSATMMKLFEDFWCGQVEVTFKQHLNNQ